jgi:hypothetical protein
MMAKKGPKHVVYNFHVYLEYEIGPTTCDALLACQLKLLLKDAVDRINLAQDRTHWRAVVNIEGSVERLVIF